MRAALVSVVIIITTLIVVAVVAVVVVVVTNAVANTESKGRRVHSVYNFCPSP